MTRPVLPRASSAKSGLRFCGIMLLPVVYSSDSLTNPNSSEDQMTSSSPIRDRWTAHAAAAEWKSSRKSLSDTASMLLALTDPKPSSFATDSRSMGYGTPASAPLPSGITSAR